ncbi:MAG: SDR family oxidoreductase [Sphingobacterium sp.]
MQIELNGRNALVGGASGGLGLGIAKQLADCGASICLMARNEEKLNRALLELDTSKGQQHSYLLTNFNQHDEHVERLEAFFQQHRIDILINNSNGPSAGGVLNKSMKDYQEAFDLLFQNIVFTTNLALEHMRRQQWGRIINVSSLTTKQPQDNLVLSNTMRVALISWAKSLSRAVAEQGITVNSILTGYFSTDRLTSLMEGQATAEGVSLSTVQDKRIEQIPAKRLGKPEEYGQLAAFLASEYAAYLTGASIPLDGGLSDTVL